MVFINDTYYCKWNIWSNKDLEEYEDLTELFEYT